MTREEFDIGLELLKGEGVTLDLLSGLTKLVDEYIKTLEATIEAQEIIIKDKSAIMEAMAQPKTCDSCEYIEIHAYRAHETATCTNKKCNEMYYCDVGSDFCCNYYEPKAQYE